MESLSMVSHTNALIKNRDTIDINLYEQFIKYLDASPKTVETYKKSLKQMFSYLLSNNVTSPRREDLLAIVTICLRRDLNQQQSKII